MDSINDGPGTCFNPDRANSVGPGGSAVIATSDPTDLFNRT